MVRMAVECGWKSIEPGFSWTVWAGLRVLLNRITATKQGGQQRAVWGMPLQRGDRLFLPRLELSQPGCCRAALCFMVRTCSASAAAQSTALGRVHAVSWEALASPQSTLCPQKQNRAGPCCSRCCARTELLCSSGEAAGSRPWGWGGRTGWSTNGVHLTAARP